MPRSSELIGPCHSPGHFYETRDRENSAWALLRRWELLAVPKSKRCDYVEPFAHRDDLIAYKYQEERRRFATLDKCLAEHRDPRNVPVCHFFQRCPREALVRLVPVEVAFNDEALAEWLFLEGGPYLHCHFCKSCWWHMTHHCHWLVVCHNICLLKNYIGYHNFLGRCGISSNNVLIRGLMFCRLVQKRYCQLQHRRCY